MKNGKDTWVYERYIVFAPRSVDDSNSVVS